MRVSMSVFVCEHVCLCLSVSMFVCVFVVCVSMSVCKLVMCVCVT